MSTFSGVDFFRNEWIQESLVKILMLEITRSSAIDSEYMRFWRPYYSSFTVITKRIRTPKELGSESKNVSEYLIQILILFIKVVFKFDIDLLI